MLGTQAGFSRYSRDLRYIDNALLLVPSGWLLLVPLYGAPFLRATCPGEGVRDGEVALSLTFLNFKFSILLVEL